MVVACGEIGEYFREESRGESEWKDQGLHRRASRNGVVFHWTLHHHEKSIRRAFHFGFQVGHKTRTMEGI